MAFDAGCWFAQAGRQTPPALPKNRWLQAILVCRAQRARPTLTTVFEIASLASPLIKPPRPPDAGPLLRLVGGALRVVRAFAPAVVVGQGVRLVTTLVNRQQGASVEPNLNDTSTDGALPAQRTLGCPPCPPVRLRALRPWRAA
jgi:hypothetical protein